MEVLRNLGVISGDFVSEHMQLAEHTFLSLDQQFDFAFKRVRVLCRIVDLIDVIAKVMHILWILVVASSIAATFKNGEQSIQNTIIRENILQQSLQVTRPLFHLEFVQFYRDNRDHQVQVYDINDNRENNIEDKLIICEFIVWRVLTKNYLILLYQCLY